MAELKVSDVEAIKKFFDERIAHYKDKGKPPEKLFYDIYGTDGKRIGAARKGMLVENAEKELTALGEGKYFLQDAEVKIEVSVSPSAKKEPAKEKVAPSPKKESSKTLNDNEAAMSEDRTMFDSLKDSGKTAMDKVVHGAQQKIASKAVDAVLLKLWAKSGKNPLLGEVLNDELGRAGVKALIGLIAIMAADQKQFSGSEYVKTVAGLILESSGSEAAGPLMDMITPLLGELLSAGKEITELSFEKVMADGKSNNEEIDEAALAEELKKYAKKDLKEAKVG